VPQPVLSEVKAGEAGDCSQPRPLVEKHYGHLATSYVREAIRAAKPLGIGDKTTIVRI
jgi:hypothetical protein